MSEAIRLLKMGLEQERRALGIPKLRPPEHQPRPSRRTRRTNSAPVIRLADMVAPMKQWFARVKEAAQKDPLPEKTPQDTALTFIFQAFDQVFPNINMTLNTD